MGLSEREQEIFKGIEEELGKSDPRFVKQARKESARAQRRAQVRQARARVTRPGATKQGADGLRALGVILGGVLLFWAGLTLRVGMFQGLGFMAVVGGVFVLVARYTPLGAQLEARWERRMSRQ